MIHNLLNPMYIVALFGYAGLAAIVFAESGLLAGFFLPGDTLLITAGIFASQGHLNIVATIAIIIMAAIIGDSVGYLFGTKAGPKLFKRKDSRWFSQDNLHEAHVFFEKYGGQSVVLARFIPVVRTFVPVIAGASRMSYRKFFIFNILGGVLWGMTVTMLGYTLGRIVPNIDSYILPVVITVSVLSFIPAVMHLRKRAKVEEVS
jgi:membrane-associated protein